LKVKIKTIKFEVGLAKSKENGLEKERRRYRWGKGHKQLEQVIADRQLLH